MTTAIVERSFSAMKLFKTRLCSRFGEDALEHTMCVCIEGPGQLSDDVLESVVDHYNRVKKHKLPLKVIQFNFNSTFRRRKIHLVPQEIFQRPIAVIFYLCYSLTINKEYSGIPIFRTLDFSNLPIFRNMACFLWIYFSQTL